MDDFHQGNTSESEAGEDYYVEEILQKRIVSGKVEYLVKWKEFGKTVVWEQSENLGCPDLINQFECRWKQNERHENEKIVAAEQKPPAEAPVQDNSEKEVNMSSVSTAKKLKTTGPQPAGLNEVTGFDLGRIPKEIIGVARVHGELMFLMTWEDYGFADLAPARQANIKCPELVISYYESRSKWGDGSNVIHGIL